MKFEEMKRELIMLFPELTDEFIIKNYGSYEIWCDRIVHLLKEKSNKLYKIKVNKNLNMVNEHVCYKIKKIHESLRFSI